MSTHYVMKEMPDVKGTGKQMTYPQMVMTGQTSTRELSEYIALKCAFPKGVTEGVICELGEALAHEMAQGRSVKIDGLGVFTPALALRLNKEREENDEDSTHRNAQSIIVEKINFKTDKELAWKTNKHCRLTRAPWKPLRSSKAHTPEERLCIAQKYLNEHTFLTVGTYRQLTGLLQTAATTELRQWAHTRGSGITYSGQGCHKVYIKKIE